MTSAIFHNLGPAFAVLLFAQIDVLGVAWLRIASAALVFALIARPWRILLDSTWAQRRLLVALGAVLGLMNSSFYLALERLRLATVSTLEFLGPVILAALGMRTPRNVVAFVVAIGGVALLADARLADEPWGFFFAAANCALFMLYVVLGHRIAAGGGTSGITRLGAAMIVAMVVAVPIGIADAVPAFRDPVLLGAAFGMGVCSSVIPYVCDQLAMARLPRATFALMLSLLPAAAVIIGIVVLRQIPNPLELLGVGLVIIGVSVHRATPAPTLQGSRSSNGSP